MTATTTSPKAGSGVPDSDAWTSGLMRAFEIMAALGCLILFLPISLAIGLIARRGSKGPTLDLQKRIGRNGQPFREVSDLLCGREVGLAL
jgi:lipopolysaccharide/colanic/teichoic acid biosynthesis glycosyltransferase